MAPELVGNCSTVLPRLIDLEEEGEPTLPEIELRWAAPELNHKAMFKSGECSKVKESIAGKLDDPRVAMAIRMFFDIR